MSTSYGFFDQDRGSLDVEGSQMRDRVEVTIIEGMTEATFRIESQERVRLIIGSLCMAAKHVWEDFEL